MREVTSGVGKGGLSELGKGALFMKTWAWKKSLSFLWTLFLPRPLVPLRHARGKNNHPLPRDASRGNFIKSCKSSMGRGGGALKQYCTLYHITSMRRRTCYLIHNLNMSVSQRVWAYHGPFDLSSGSP